MITHLRSRIRRFTFRPLPPAELLISRMANDDLTAGLLDRDTQHTSDPVYDSEKKFSDNMVADSLDDDVDSIHEGMQFPTEEEMLTLRRVSDKIPWSAYLIAVVELAERFSYYGMLLTLIAITSRQFSIRHFQRL
ncbi:hypothetical protein F4604DRAFT_918681 [Suillus subluteus]|nr:hypothetical protein F4604DRAFT_918681 [Suillus subluteus]